MVHYTIKLEEYRAKGKVEVEIPVDEIVSVYECAPLHLGKTCIPLSRILIGRNVERSYFVKDTLRNIQSKIKNGFEEYIQTSCSNPDALLSLSLDEFPVFHITSDINQHALVMLPLNRIDHYKNSHKERCIVSINGHEFYINESRLKLTNIKGEYESYLIQIMRNHNVI